jgi:membrane protease YdiL (CAAX protease family)
MRYAPFDSLTGPAADSRELWRLVLGLMLAMTVMFGLARGVVALVRGLAPPEAYLAFVAGLEAADTPGGLLSLLVLMGAMGLATVVVCELVHRRSASTLFGPRRRFWAQFWQVSFAVLLVQVMVAGLPPWPLQTASEPGLPAGLWLMLLPVTLGALMVQVVSEELFFRGYFQSQLAARVSHPLVWLCLPSAVFALGHYAPEVYGSNALAVALWAFVFGVAVADLTARSGTLAPAVALHLVNNFMALGVTSLSGEMSGLALMKYPFGPEDEAALAVMLPIDLALMVVNWLAARLVLRV